MSHHLAKQAHRVQKFTPKLNYALLLDHLNYQLNQPARESDHDFFAMLEECSTHFDVSTNFLMQRGFRKAYRQILEGL